ncbi:MAG: insulinase family protein [Gammaproteobacteria bacterium]|nr:insulinase family protein [Gammaproteobacteria bacterium]
MQIKIFTLLMLFATAVVASPEIKQWETSNGARVYYVYAPELPMVDINVTFDAGSARDGGKGGLALMTNGMLGEGAAGMDSDQIAEKFESVGAQFSNSSLRDMSVFSLRTLTDDAWMKTAADTFAKVINQPSFPKDAFERERKRLLVSIEQKKQSPEAISEDAFYAAVYGKHPYASPSGGTEVSVKALEVEDLKAFYQRYYVGKNVVVAIVGSIDRNRAAALADQVVGKLPAGAPAEALREVKPLDAAVKEQIDFPSSQTHIMLGLPGISRDDPDYFPLFVGNHILGGSGLVSRISDEIREKRGLSYSAYSYFAPMRAAGPFVMGLQTRNEQAEEALKVMHQTLSDFIAKGPSQAELVAAQKNLVGGFALRIDSNGKIVGNLASIGFYNLPLDYLDTYIGKVEAVTVSQIRDAFARRVNPDKMVTVMVGSKAAK